jgi:NAD(P)-dependent dehydrogenase (short-subunit alcohol dehydrogenase family)
MAESRLIAVVIWATSKWQSDVSISARWGLGGAVAQKFAREGYHVVVTTRAALHQTFPGLPDSSQHDHRHHK